ncbi:MAG: hypothetical protein CMP62_05580 [Flavobacteriales bacterium]|nr:hypothetical protein [Flavobacteriales bacterium]|tara:strand:- start:5202 stop:6257 length:1056 start_codon:yes stop_codon:yes gene_type:complete
MKNIILTITIFGLQSYIISQGVVFDKERFAKFAKDNPIETTRSFIPNRASIKAYAPYNYKQIGNTCVAHSLAMARTILYAKNFDLDNKIDIIKNLFSVKFLYQSTILTEWIRNDYDGVLTLENGNLSLDPLDAIDVIQNTGFAKVDAENHLEFNTCYPFTENICYNEIIPLNTYEELIATTQEYSVAIKGLISNDSYSSKLNKIKSEISQGRPVLFGIYTPPSFKNLDDKELWIPNDSGTKKSIAHQMLIVSYDDSRYNGSFEIMNSWGTQWGKDGYVWVQYADLIKHLEIAYSIQETFYAFNNQANNLKHQLKSQKNIKFGDGDISQNNAIKGEEDVIEKYKQASYYKRN